MSNKLLGILIIIGFIGAGYLYYKISYLPSQKIVEEKNEVVKKKPLELIKQDIILEKELTNEEKIKDLKKKSKYYVYFDLGNSKIVYFKENKLSLDLYYRDLKIASFNKEEKKDLEVQKIRGIENDLYIKVGLNKYYYNFQNSDILKIELGVSINYVKKGNSDTILFGTDKGTYVYSKRNKNIEYFTYFYDFVMLDDYYIGFVSNKDKRRVNNYGLDGKKNLIMIYNPNTKEKKIIFELQNDIKEMYIYSGKLSLIDSNGESYILENLKL